MARRVHSTADVSWNGRPIVRPTPALQRWQDQEVGMFYHLTMDVFDPAYRWRDWGRLPDPAIVTLDRLDMDAWLAAATAIGAKYAVLVVKHCDGFCFWQTDIYPYGMKQSPWRNGKGDLLAEFVAACERVHILPGIYASTSANAWFEVDNPGLVNRGRGGDPVKQQAYNRACEAMMTELWSRYGKLFEIWFDGGLLPPEQGGPDLLPILEREQPEAVVFQGMPGMRNNIRWVGNERGRAPDPCWATIDAVSQEGGDRELRLAGAPDGRIWAPAECDVPVRNHAWTWRANEEQKLYSLDELLTMYDESVGRYCNLLLNANPDNHGEIPAADFALYEAFGKALRRRNPPSFASTSGSGTELTLDFGRVRGCDHVVLMEDITCGERVLQHVVERRVGDGAWESVAAGTCIGHKRIHRFPAVEAPAMRLRVLGCKAEPSIRAFSAGQSEGGVA